MTLGVPDGSTIRIRKLAAASLKAWNAAGTRQKLVMVSRQCKCVSLEQRGR